MKKLRIAVVGGGIGGLNAAAALCRRGMDVTVFEQARQLGEIGAGVQLTPNSIRLLERAGLKPRIDEVAVQLSPQSSYFRMDGSRIGPVVTSDSSGEYGVYGIHRADLVDVLAGSLPPGVVRTGYTCTGFTQTEDQCELRFADGSTFTCDAVIAADGIHSTLRDNIVEREHPVHSGSVAYRGLVPAASMPSWPTDRFQLWMGKGKHFLTFPVRSGTIINYVGFVPSEEQAKESWSAKGDPDRLRREFAGWDPQLGELLDKVESTFWWGLYDREPLKTWTKGRLTLLGDAGHPMLPHLGQGANQAIEDGVAVAAVLARATDPSELPDLLRVYEELRRERTTEVQVGSRANGRRYDSHYDDIAQRDTEIESSRPFRLWLYDYDVEAEFAVAD